MYLIQNIRVTIEMILRYNFTINGNVLTIFEQFKIKILIDILDIDWQLSTL